MLRGLRRRYFGPIVFGFTVGVLILWFQGHFTYNNNTGGNHGGAVEWGNDVFEFEDMTRPDYLDEPLETPMRIRLAIMSRVEEFERRQALRESMLRGVLEGDVRLDYRFLVGKAPDWRMRYNIWRESRSTNDLLVLEDLHDVKERISEKRFHALKWTNSIPQKEYDYAMTIDSDTFCRLSALARRLRSSYHYLKPIEQPILIGRLIDHRVYYENTVPDGNKNDADEDFSMSGPWYPFPIGYAYMLSSNLTATLLSADPSIPHHVHYPKDDVMVGAWIAALKHYHDPSVVFESTLESAPPPPYRVYPKPYLPYIVDTKTVSIKSGWHDFKGRGNDDAAIGWETVCVHRMTPEEMRAFRDMEDIETEWDNSQ